MNGLIFEQVSLGGNRNFGFVIGCEFFQMAALVDPAFIPETLVEIACHNGLRVTHILNTHGHPNHTNGNALARELCPSAVLVAHPLEVPDATMPCVGGEMFHVGHLPVEVIHTPGHSPGSLCFFVQGELLLTGDELFVGKVGGTNFPRSDARAQHHSLFDILLRLDDAVTIWPGHDFGPTPSSTIGDERRTNPFLQCPDFADFQWLKDHWDEYKQQHRIA